MIPVLDSQDSTRAPLPAGHLVSSSAKTALGENVFHWKGGENARQAMASSRRCRKVAATLLAAADPECLHHHPGAESSSSATCPSSHFSLH